MLNDWREDALIATASRLSGAQLSLLASGTRKAMGSGLGAYLGLHSSSLTAVRAASTTIESSGRSVLMTTKAARLDEAVLTAAIGAAQSDGLDPSSVRAAWEDFKAAVDSGDSGRQKEAFQSARKAFLRGLGRRLYRRWLMASIGASWALVALVSWDLTTENGPYRPEQRDILTGPWRTVAALPRLAD